jgi:hypothetical protein
MRGACSPLLWLSQELARLEEEVRRRRRSVMEREERQRILQRSSEQKHTDPALLSWDAPSVVVAGPARTPATAGPALAHDDTGAGAVSAEDGAANGHATSTNTTSSAATLGGSAQQAHQQPLPPAANNINGEVFRFDDLSGSESEEEFEDLPTPPGAHHNRPSQVKTHKVHQTHGGVGALYDGSPPPKTSEVRFLVAMCATLFVHDDV